jgi:Tol biopolymer transport system component
MTWVGDRIYASTPLNEWLIVEPGNGGTTPLFSDRAPHFQLSACPDGKHVVYSTWREGAFAIWRADADGSNPMKLAEQTVAGGALCMPDSKTVLYATEAAIWRISLDGGQPEKTNLPLANFGFSHDGKLMVLALQKVEGGAMHAQVAVSPAEGGPAIFTFTPPFGMRVLGFTPDNKALAYMLTRDRAGNLWKQPLTGGPAVQVTKFTDGDMFDYAWSADGKRLALARGQRKTDVIMISSFR